MIAIARSQRRPVADADLLASITKGDLDALGTLFDRYEPKVRGYLARMGVGSSDIDDLVQATFLEVMRAAPRFDPAMSVSSWLLGIASIMVRRHRRSISRALSRLMQWTQAMQSVKAPVTPAEAFESSDAERRFQRAFDRLSLKKREVFTLIVLEGIRGEEVARALDIPINTVWTRLHHARNDLRAALSEGES